MKKENKYEVGTRRCINARLKTIFHKEHEFIEVTEWTNGEGYDVHIGVVNGPQTFSLHDTEWELVKKLIKRINK